jgi:pilus assembly protein CpaF
MVTMAGFDLPLKTIRTQIASAIDVVIQLERLEDGKRRVVSVCEVNTMEGDIITMSEIFKYERKGIDEQGNVIGKHSATGIVPRFNDQLKQRGLCSNMSVFAEMSF